MCGCEATFVCSRCAGTPDDPRYLDDEPRTPEEERQARLGDYNDRTAEKAA